MVGWLDSLVRWMSCLVRWLGVCLLACSAVLFFALLARPVCFFALLAVLCVALLASACSLLCLVRLLVLLVPFALHALPCFALVCAALLARLLDCHVCPARQPALRMCTEEPQNRCRVTTILSLIRLIRDFLDAPFVPPDTDMHTADV